MKLIESEYSYHIIVNAEQWLLNGEKKACKSSEDTQVAGYAQFEKVWAR